jgi:hypothetical protein
VGGNPEIHGRVDAVAEVLAQAPRNVMLA